MTIECNAKWEMEFQNVSGLPNGWSVWLVWIPRFFLANGMCTLKIQGIEKYLANLFLFYIHCEHNSEE